MDHSLTIAGFVLLAPLALIAFLIETGRDDLADFIHDRAGLDTPVAFLWGLIAGVTFLMRMGLNLL